MAGNKQDISLNCKKVTNRLNTLLSSLEHNDYLRMKKSILYIALCMLSFLQISCEDNREQFLDDYSTILYFRNSGEIEYSIYKTEELTKYTVSVVKAGSNKNTVATVELKIMDESTLADYNEYQGTHYKILPSDCYSIKTGQLAFDIAEMYKKIDVAFHTEAINALQKEEQANNYIVPLFLCNSADSINAEKKYLFIKPEVVTPVVGFEKIGYVMNFFSETGDSHIDLTLPLSLSIENKWSFDCHTKVNETLLEVYNKEQGANLMLLPPASYTMNEDGVVKMTPNGENKLNITVSREKLSYGNYVLPLSLTGTSYEAIDVDQAKNSCLFGVSYVPDVSKLPSVHLVESMISYHPNSICEGSVAELIDGDPGTYFHSDYSVGVALPHWLQFALSDEISAFRFEYVTRNAGSHVVPHKVTLYGSADGVEFRKIIVMDDELPFDVGQTYISPVLVTGEKIKYIRMTVNESPSGSFALAEFRLWAL